MLTSQFKSVVRACKITSATSKLILRASLSTSSPPAPPQQEPHPDSRSHEHFRLSTKPHPLNTKRIIHEDGDHTGLQQNHIWSKEELDEMAATMYRHQPKTWSDYIVNKTVRMSMIDLSFSSPFDCSILCPGSLFRCTPCTMSSISSRDTRLTTHRCRLWSGVSLSWRV